MLIRQRSGRLDAVLLGGILLLLHKEWPTFLAKPLSRWHSELRPDLAERRAL